MASGSLTTGMVASVPGRRRTGAEREQLGAVNPTMGANHAESPPGGGKGSVACLLVVPRSFGNVSSIPSRATSTGAP